MGYILLLDRVVSTKRFIFKNKFLIRRKKKCHPRNRTSPRMLPRPRTMPTTTLAGRDPAPPAKSRKPKGALSLAAHPGNDRNRRNVLRRNAEKHVRLPHAAVLRAVQAKAVPRSVQARAVPGAVQERAVLGAAEEKAAERADLRPESRPTPSALTKSRLTTSRATSVICARSEIEIISQQ